MLAFRFAWSAWGGWLWWERGWRLAVMVGTGGVAYADDPFVTHSLPFGLGQLH